MPQHLSQITTLWTMVRRLHAGETSQRVPACDVLLQRYADPVRRYLRKLLRDAEAADELFQEFALRLAEGRYAQADPRRGRFRDYVKSSLYHLIADYRRRQAKQMRQLAVDAGVPAVRDESDDPNDREFLESWRDSLLARTWQALAEFESETQHSYHAVLKVRVHEPELRTPELARRVSERIGRDVSDGAVRVLLHRARKTFAELLLDEVAETLDAPTADDLENELIELKLLSYCRPALDGRRSAEA